jgi:antitoxin (DNA-binding transcriptional repressor) of toxin-antitoxin stability system
VNRVEEVSTRQLRNHRDDVVDRVAAGERLTVAQPDRP